MNHEYNRNDYNYNRPPAQDSRGGYGGGGGGRGGYSGGGQGYGQGGGYGQRGQGQPYGGHHERRGVPLSDLDPALTDISRKVIGCAIEVHRSLGPGYDLEVYRSALRQELDAVGVQGSFAHSLDVQYKGKKVGTAVADLYVDGKFIVTLMNRPGNIGGYERAQLRSQLKAGNLDLGLIINFGERRLKDGLVRVLNIEKLQAERGSPEGEYEDDDAEETPADGSSGNTVSFS